MFSYVSLEERVPRDHPLRAIRHITDRALDRLSPQFGTLYINFGRPSIPPERLLRGCCSKPSTPSAASGS
jgi:transposase